MIDTILAVRTAELREFMGGRTFIALPQEEIDRHFASLEIVEARGREVLFSGDTTPLEIHAVVHYNYSWLTYFCPDQSSGQRSLSIRGPMAAGAVEHLFLDESWREPATAIIEQELLLPDQPEIRLAGLIYKGSGALALVYVVRLRQAGARSRGGGVSQIEFRGMGELQEQHTDLDSWSQTIARSLSAL